MTGTWRDDLLTAIRAELDGLGLRHVDGEAGEVVVPFEDDGHRSILALRVGETTELGVTLAASASAPIPRDRWGEALVSINGWNAATVGPQAHLRVDDWATSETGVLLLQSWLPASASGTVVDGQLRAAISAMLRSCALLLLAAGVEAPHAEG